MLNATLEREKKTIHRVGFMNIDDIIIPPRFKDVGVREEKIQACIDYYYKHGCMDKAITIRHNHYLVDEYSRYCAAMWPGLKKVYVEYI